MTPAQSRAARGLLDWTITAAAQRANLNKNTVQRFETGGNVYSDTIRALERAYINAGVIFTGKTGVRLETDDSA